jgi:hypothetical protein
MVASISAAVPTAIPASALTGRGGLVRFTVDDVLAVIREGMVAEDASAELLNGFIVHTDRSAHGVNPTMHSPAHRKAVRRLTALAAKIDSAERHVQIQSPVVCGIDQMPEPDFAIVRGNDDACTNRLPSGADVLHIVELADSSLERDRDEKGPIYARAGVAQYVILTLRNRTAEVYVEPDTVTCRYAQASKVTAGGTLPLRIGETETIVIDLEMLP